MSATLFDVSRKANVSIATVSRVVNDSAKVDEETRRRVEQAIAELGYHPNYAARALVNQRSNTIQTVLPAFGAGFYNQILLGMNEVCQAAGYHLTIMMSQGDEDARNLFMRAAFERRADALIVPSVTLPEKFLHDLAARKFPMVSVGKKIPHSPIPTVSIDNAGGTRQMVRHLVETHHYRNIVLITGLSDNQDSNERLEACLAAAKDADIVIPYENVWGGNFLEHSGYEITMTRLKASPPPDVIFALNDSMAFGVQTALKELVLDVPLVGFDDIRGASFRELTTVSIDIHAVGREAARLAIQAARHEPTDDIVIPAELRIRQSCGCGTGK